MYSRPSLWRNQDRPDASDERMHYCSIRVYCSFTVQILAGTRTDFDQSQTQPRLTVEGALGAALALPDKARCAVLAASGHHGRRIDGSRGPESVT
jgi:hypothetical protein